MSDFKYSERHHKQVISIFWILIFETLSAVPFLNILKEPYHYHVSRQVRNITGNSKGALPPSNHPPPFWSLFVIYSAIILQFPHKNEVSDLFPSFFLFFIFKYLRTINFLQNNCIIITNCWTLDLWNSYHICKRSRLKKSPVFEWSGFRMAMLTIRNPDTSGFRIPTVNAIVP